MRYRFNSFIHVTLICIIFLVIFEVISGLLLHHFLPFGNSFLNSKNPLYRRGWYTYTTPMQKDTDYLIIVITNSQGYSPLDLQTGLYTDDLEKLLNDNSDKSYKVLNWSMPGGHSVEYISGLTRLIDYDPDLVIVSSHAESFTINQNLPIQNYRNDIVRLSYQMPYRNYLSDEFIRRHSINDPLWALLYNTNLGDVHQFIQDGGDWDHLQEAPYLDPREPYRVNEWDDDSYWYVNELFGSYERITNFETPLIVISMPVNRNRRREARYNPMKEFGEVLKNLKPENDNVFVADAIDAVDYDYFYDGTHYYLEGHQAYGSYLFDLIISLPILENSESGK